MGEQFEAGIPGHVLATYREIAVHFGLQGPHSARTRAKREGWQAEPPNHPADPLRIRVPREIWEGARSRGRGERREVTSSERKEPASQTGEIKALQSHIETIREDVLRAEQRVERAEQRAVKAEERAEKAEQRLIDELARLAGQNVHSRALYLDGMEQNELGTLAAELDLEFAEEGREDPPEKGPTLDSEPLHAEAGPLDGEASSKPESAAPVLPLVPESRRIWWSRFIPRRQR